MSDDNRFAELIGEALRCAEEQHEADLRALHKFENRLAANTDQLKAEFAGVMVRHRQRQELLREDVIDVAFEIVGEQRPSLAKPADDLPRIFDNAADMGGYDYDEDPLMIGARRH